MSGPRRKRGSTTVAEFWDPTGFGEPPGRPVGASEGVAGGEGVGVGAAQDLLAVGQGPLVQRDGLGHPAGQPVCESEVVAGEPRPASFPLR
jgi:hypothetical protein